MSASMSFPATVKAIYRPSLVCLGVAAFALLLVSCQDILGIDPTKFVFEHASVRDAGGDARVDSPVEDASFSDSGDAAASDAGPCAIDYSGTWNLPPVNTICGQ